jgi:2-polyprenyl-6-methoxyphenol hydroxylase-like FAD-dependent oxidoreductase
VSEQTAPTLDALVVGAGPVGLMMAGELARHGLSCRVVDQNDTPSTTSKALGVHSRTLEVFEDIGVLDQALARGRQIHANNVYADGKRIVHVELDELDAPYPMILDLPQSDTEAILEQLAGTRGVKVERQTRLTALAQDGDGVRATVEHGGAREEIRARWVLGCDGAHSTVRHALDVTFDGAPYDDVWLAADVALDWDLVDDELHAFLSPEGALVAFPLPDPRRVRIIYDRPGDSVPAPAPADRDARPAPVPAPSLEDVQAVLTARTGLRGTVSDPRWLVGFRIHRRIASAYRQGRVFLAGDAAHIHSPVGGQGMNTGIQDAYNLAWKLALVTRGAARPSLLDSYQAERHPIAAATVLGTDLATQLVTLRHPIARWARNRLTEVLSGVEVIQQRGLRAASQIAIGYRKSPIVAEHRASVIAARLGVGGPEQPSFSEWLDFGAAPRPGDRAPDARYHTGHAADGEHRLFDLLRGTRHNLLLFDGAASTPAGYRNLASIAGRVRQRLGAHITSHIVVPRISPPPELGWDGSIVLDAEGDLHRRYGAGSECLYLIRPDGYVGFRSQPADGAALDAFLSGIFAGG